MVGTYRHSVMARMIVVSLVVCVLVGLWQPNQAQAQGEWHEVGMLGRGTVNQTVLSPDGKLLATGGSAGIWLYELPDLTPVTLLQGHTDEVTSLAFSPDGEILASGGGYWDKTVRLWDMKTRTEMGVLTGATQAAENVVFSPDGQLVAAIDPHGDRVLIWEVATQTEFTTISGNDDILTQIAFTPDGKSLLLVDRMEDQTGQVRFWDLESESVTATLTGHTATILNLTFSADGQTLATGDEDGYIFLWDMDTQREIKRIYGQGQSISSLLFTPDEQSLVVALFYPSGAFLGSTGTVTVWDLNSLTKSNYPPDNPPYIVNIAYYSEHPTHILDVLFILATVH